MNLFYPLPESRMYTKLKLLGNQSKEACSGLSLVRFERLLCISAHPDPTQWVKPTHPTRSGHTEGHAGLSSESWRRDSNVTSGSRWRRGVGLGLWYRLSIWGPTPASFLSACPWAGDSPFLCLNLPMNEMKKILLRVTIYGHDGGGEHISHWPPATCAPEMGQCPRAPPGVATGTGH